MIHVECPWCAEPVTVETAIADLACDTCGIVVEVAADRIAGSLDRAA